SPHSFLIRLFIERLLYFQVLAHGKETSKETNADSQNQTDRKEDLVNCTHRQKINDILQDTELLHNILYCLVIEEVQKHERNRRAENTDDQTFDHERRTHDKIFCADIFHDRDLFLSDRDTHRNGIADQENRYAEQDHNDRKRYNCYECVYTGQCICHHI